MLERFIALSAYTSSRFVGYIDFLKCYILELNILLRMSKIFSHSCLTYHDAIVLLYDIIKLQIAGQLLIYFHKMKFCMVGKRRFICRRRLKVAPNYVIPWPYLIYLV